MLQAFAGQVAIAVQQRALRADAARAGDLEAANELRTALLAAVSHDLRTPLSSIKAAVTSLLQRDVDFTPAATRELLDTIDDGADRLNQLIGNLLDMSRLQTGALQPAMRAVALEEVIPAALAGLSDAERVDADVPETLPRVQADAGLLERAVANLDRECAEVVARPTRVCAWKRAWPTAASTCASSTAAPGYRVAQREQVFQPFQRLGDSSNDTGVGLGLAVARGFVEAMGGTILVDDTPGGGVTIDIGLEVAPS